MPLPPQWNDNGEHETRNADRYGLPSIIRGLLGLSSLAELKAVPPTSREDYSRIRVAGGNVYVWSPTSSLTADDKLVVAPTYGTGRWLLAPNQLAKISLPFTSATADAAALLTIPTGAKIIPRDFLWNITANMTGGAGSAIGVSSSAAGYTTKGDLLGGAAGDVAATLTVANSPTYGTIGTVWTTLTQRQLILKAADVVRFNQIVSAFTAGAGSVDMIAYVLANAGA